MDPVHLLLHDQQGRSRLVDASQPVVDGVDDDRRKPEGDLVGHQQLGGRRHDTLARESMRCCAAGERAAPLLAALTQDGKAVYARARASSARFAPIAGGRPGGGSPRR